MTRKEFIGKFNLQYGWLLRNNKRLLNELVPMDPMTMSECKAIALLYVTLAQWRTEHPYSYGRAKCQGWMSECTRHLKKERHFNGFWNKKRCKSKGLKYKTKKEWRRTCPSSYAAAYRNGWLLELTMHMKTLRGKSSKTKVKNLDTGDVFESVTIAKIKYRGDISAVCTGRQKTAGGYRWAYYDEKIHGPIVDGKIKI